MRLLLAIFAAPLLTPSILLCQKPEPSKAPYSKGEIRQVLILARDAVLQEQSDGDSGWLGRHQEGIMLAFKSINDWRDASVLQKKAGTLYAPPHPTLADYKALQNSLRNLDEYAREPSLSVVVGESASDGFFDYAEHLAATIKDAQTQSDAYLEIGTALWKKGKHDTARKYFEAAVNAAGKMHSSVLGDVTQNISQQLNRIAERRFTEGDYVGANEVFAKCIAVAEEADEPGFHLSRDLLLDRTAATQKHLGLLPDARQTAEKIGDKELSERTLAWIARAERRQEILNSPPAEAKKAISSISDPYDKAEILTTLADQRWKRGEHEEALKTLDEAFEIAETLDPDGPVIGGLGYRYRIIAVAYLDAGAREKATMVLDRLALIEAANPGSDDFIFDLAIGYSAIGDFDRAHAFIAEWGDQDSDEQACEIVAYQQAHQRGAQGAVAWAVNLKNSAARTSALVGIAEAMIDLNQEQSKQSAGCPIDKSEGVVKAQVSWPVRSAG